MRSDTASRNINKHTNTMVLFILGYVSIIHYIDQVIRRVNSFQQMPADTATAARIVSALALVASFVQNIAKEPQHCPVFVPAEPQLCLEDRSRLSECSGRNQELERQLGVAQSQASFLHTSAGDHTADWWRHIVEKVLVAGPGLLSFFIILCQKVRAGCCRRDNQSVVSRRTSEIVWAYPEDEYEAWSQEALAPRQSVGSVFGRS